VTGLTLAELVVRVAARMNTAPRSPLARVEVERVVEATLLELATAREVGELDIDVRLPDPRRRHPEADPTAVEPEP
jgi:hypothetical protein